MEHIDNANLIKIGIIVNDIEAAIDKYCKLFNIPKPHIQIPDAEDRTDQFTERNYTIYRGEKRDTKTKFANLQMGPVTVELMEPFDGPSPWNEYKQKHGQGVHFITFNVDDFEEHLAFLESQGLPLVHKGEYGSGRYAYVDSEDQLGVTLGVQQIKQL